MSGQRGFWQSLGPVVRQPLVYQPFVIVAYVLGALAWVAIAAAACAVRLAAVVAGELAFVGGIVLCLIGLGHIGAPLGVVGFVTSRLAA